MRASSTYATAPHGLTVSLATSYLRWCHDGQIPSEPDTDSDVEQSETDTESEGDEDDEDTVRSRHGAR